MYFFGIQFRTAVLFSVQSCFRLAEGRGDKYRYHRGFFSSYSALCMEVRLGSCIGPVLCEENRQTKNMDVSYSDRASNLPCSYGAVFAED